MNRFHLSGALATASLLLAACETPRPRFDARQPNPNAFTTLASGTRSSTIVPDLLKPSTNLFTLGPGDRIEIEIVNDPTTKATTLVGLDGKIYYYLLPGLDVWGRTLAETKGLLEQELSKLIRDGPQVTVALRSVASKHVWLLGRLAAPGIYPLAGPMTLLEAIARAGGPGSRAGLAAAAPTTRNSSPVAAEADLADLRHSFVMRRGNRLPVDFYRLVHQGDLSQNIQLEPDDFVYLPSTEGEEVFLLGAVSQPGIFRFTPRMSLVAALARAGGTVSPAYLDQIAIVRGSLTEPQIAVVDYREITQGRSPDVLIEPGDIIYVPSSPYRTLLGYADLVANTFVRTIGVNEGARAVSRNIAPVGANVPIGQ